MFHKLVLAIFYSGVGPVKRYVHVISPISSGLAFVTKRGDQ